MHPNDRQPNAEVDYVDANTGAVIATERFYDPGLDEQSSYTIEQKQRGIWRGPHAVYGCGRRAE